MTKIATDLRLWREQFYLTQSRAAEIMSVSLRSYSGYETGKRVPLYRDIQRMNAIMDAYYHGREIGLDVGHPR